jgi:hypothetical protein
VNERELRAYLLGQATEDEAVRLEGRLLEDDELYQVIESIEDDLFDDHARGRLEPADRARFEARYGTDGERQRFARVLSTRVDGASPVLTFRPKPAWRRWAPLAAAAAIVIAFGAVFIERQIAPAPAAPGPPVLAPAASDVTFALTLGASRAAAEPTVLTIGPSVGAIQLRVRLNPADRFETYTVDLRVSSTDTQAWRSDDLHATIDNGDLVIAARVPAGAVPDGAYELSVRGVRAGAAAGAGEDLGFVPLKVVRVP